MPFKVYRSSAGSGKTFTLVKEYLRLALATNKLDAYRGILAVTFTNKAAEEMKSRVLEALKALSNSDLEGNSMAQALISELGITESEIALRAGKVLKHMLHHYSDVSISTIDKFSHKLIRTFSQDLGLSVNFEVELDKFVLEQGVLDELMNQVGSDPILTNALIDLVESTAEDEKGWNIDKRIKDFISVLFTEESRFHLDHLSKIELREFGALRTKLNVQIRESKKELNGIGKTAIDSVSNSGLTAQSLAGGSNGIHGYFSRLAKGDFKPPSKSILDRIENGKWYGGKATPDEKSTIDALISTLAAGFERAQVLASTVNYHQVVFNHIYGVALLDEMHRVLKQIQSEDEVLHIGEFNQLISDVVMTETAPFIYERIGARYHHFLVDEFQDTSILQWCNLLPLIDESLAHDNLCLVVGDAKQSIYRWRGGDVQQFIELPSIHKPPHVEERLNQTPHLKSLFQTREQALKASAQVESLPNNFRSKSTVVEFNNKLFESLQPQMPSAFGKMYDGSTQQIKKAEDGLVTVQMLRQDSTGKSWPEYDGYVQEQLLEWIKECLDDDYKRGDIALIFRTNKDAVKTALFLIKSGHNVVSNESLLINSSVKVRLLVNLAVFLADPNNATNISELLENFVEFTDKKDSLSEHLMLSKGGKDIKYVRNLLSSNFSEIDWKSLTQETPYSLFSVLIHGLFPNSEEPHLSFFLNEVLSFTQSKRKSLGDFIEHWIEKRDKLSIALEKNENAISILTIHKSKGLEFPVVIHPYADYPTRGGKNFIWTYIEDNELEPLDRIRIASTKALEQTPFSKDYELESSLESMDMFNELYVAVTRAKDRLYLSGKLPKNVAKDQEPTSAIQYVRKHMTAEYGLADDHLYHTIGSRVKVKPEPTEAVNLNLHRTGNPYWKDRVSIAQPSVAYTDKSEEGNARLRGIAIHDALANIKTADDINKAVQTLLEEGRISKKDTEGLISHVENLLSRPELKDLFSDGMKIRNEADIQLANGKWLRPDRVVSKENSVWVIDYKTGEERKEHKRQIEEYKNAMLQLGFKEVEGLLVYLDTENVICV